MIDKIVLSKSHTRATIYLINGKHLTLCHSEGRVLDLVTWYLVPIQSRVESMAVLISSEQDTQIINERGDYASIEPKQ